MYESSQESGREELNETIVENIPEGRRRPERKVKEKSIAVAEVVSYTHEQIDAMKLAELKEVAIKLKLSSGGNKRTLRNPIKDAMEDEENEDSEVEESDHERDEEPRNDRWKNDRREAIDAVTRQVASFTIKDVEDSLAHFSGDDKLPIDHWINDFEDTSALLGWNELQKFIYGKRMWENLRGSLSPSREKLNRGTV